MFTIAIVAAFVLLLIHFTKRPPAPPTSQAIANPSATVVAPAAIPERALHLLAGKLRKVEDNRILTSAIADLTDAPADAAQ